MDIQKLKLANAVEDNDGHWYVIPAEMREEFDDLLENAEEDDYEQFNDRFGKYATGGALDCTDIYAEF